jgi:hypothetical protein
MENYPLAQRNGLFDSRKLIAEGDYASSRCWDHYMIITFVQSATIANPRATHATHRGALRNDQTAQTRARLAKTSRNRLRWSRTVNTAFGGSGVSGLHRNMMSQWTIPYNTNISNVAAEKIKLATTSDQRGHRPEVAIADAFLGCCTVGESDTSIFSPKEVLTLLGVNKNR